MCALHGEDPVLCTSEHQESQLSSLGVLGIHPDNPLGKRLGHTIDCWTITSRATPRPESSTTPYF